MVDLEIWTCEHGVKEYFLDWQTMKQDEWKAQHDELDSDDPCEPEITSIPVEEIEEEMLD